LDNLANINYRIGFEKYCISLRKHPILASTLFLLELLFETLTNYASYFSKNHFLKE